MLGAICGDILGSSYELDSEKNFEPQTIELCLETDIFTDDTALTLAVADWLLHDVKENCNNDDALKKSLAKQFVKYSRHTFDIGERKLGFGGMYVEWLDWAEEQGDYAPYNSCGNGSATRVAPIGWCFDSLDEVLRFAKLSADVTHNHPEGEKGAMCIAAAVYLARTGHSKEEIKSQLFSMFKYDLLNSTVAHLREECEWSAICQDTVPMSVVAFLESDDYESTVKNAISYGSDSDTIAAMAGAIAEAFYGGVPTRLREYCLSKIPQKQQSLIDEFYKSIGEQSLLG